MVIFLLFLRSGPLDFKETFGPLETELPSIIYFIGTFHDLKLEKIAK